MNVLGIETSCDETATCIVENGRKVISSVVATQIDEHSLYGGVVPEIASRRHLEKIDKIIALTFKKVDLNFSDIDIIAVTNTPGLVGSLLVGVNFAKGLSFSLNKPLIAVNHLKAHIAANYLDNEDLKPPFLGLIISGGHTNIVRIKDYCDFELIGKTVDDSIGEAYDKVGRKLGLLYPAGAKIDKLSKKGDKNKYEFPKPTVGNNKFDFSFSGLKTAVLNKINQEKSQKKEIIIEDFCSSFQKVITEIVCEKIFLAAQKYNEKKIVVCGGVCANSNIRENLLKIAKLKGIKLYLPDLKYCTDNAAMVASQGFFEAKNNNFEKDYSLNAVASYQFK